jgi:dTDP-4-dehydrorhamnose reductase
MLAMKKIIVLGANGQLGNEFRQLEKDFPSFKFFFYDVAEMDIMQKDLVDRGISEVKPDFVVNCAAYTAVDKAETDKELAYAINSDAVKNISAACVAHSVKLIHISTDYVFDGEASEPYTEDSPVNPTSIYGLSKLEGEKEALQAAENAIVIRTAWVYSVYGNNFVKTMLRLMSTKPEISVVADQFGSPTYALDLAVAIMQIISEEKWIPGIYHFTNEGIINWFDFASEIKNISGLSCTIHPITTEQYPTPAKRPKYSVLDKTKIQQTFNIKLRDWKESLQDCLNKMPAN